MKAITLRQIDIFSPDKGIIFTDLVGCHIKTEIYISGTGRVTVDGIVKEMEIFDTCPGMNRFGKFKLKITIEDGFQFDLGSETITTFPTREALICYLTNAIDRVNEYLSKNSTVHQQHFFNRNGFTEAKWKLNSLNKLLKEV